MTPPFSFCFCACISFVIEARRSKCPYVYVFGNWKPRALRRNMALGHVGRNDTNQLWSLRDTLPKLRKAYVSSPLRQPHCFPSVCITAKGCGSAAFRVELRNTTTGIPNVEFVGSSRWPLNGASATVGELLVSEELCPVMPRVLWQGCCS